MVNYYIKSFTILLLLTISGFTDKTSVKRILVKEFPVNNHLTIVQESKDEIFNHAYVDLKVINDYIVVIDRKSEEILHFLDKKSLNYLFSKVSNGKGLNEISLPGPMQLVGEKLFLLDVGKKQFFQYDIKTFNNQSPLIPERIYNIPITNVIDTKLIEPNSIIVSGWIDDGLLWVYDSLGTKKEVIGEFPEGCPDEFDNKGYYNIVNHFRIDVFPDNKKYIISSIFSDKLQVFNHHGVEIINIIGPDNIKPEFIFQKRSCMMVENNNLCYIDLVVKEKYIYGLYYGYSQMTMDIPCSILVFNHGGKPLARFYLDKNIKAFDVDEEKGIFYTLQLSPNKVYKYEYEF